MGKFFSTILLVYIGCFVVGLILAVAFGMSELMYFYGAWIVAKWTFYVSVGFALFVKGAELILSPITNEHFKKTGRGPMFKRLVWRR